MAELVNPAVSGLMSDAQKDAVYQAYLQRVFELKDLPLAQATIRQMAWQSALGAAGLAGFMPIMNADGTWTIGTTPTLERDQMMMNGGLQAAQLVASLRGPRDAFAQQRAIYGLNQAGLSNAVDYVGGTLELPGFQAPQAPAEPASFGTLADQIRGTTPESATAPATTTASAAAAAAAPATNPAPGVVSGPATATTTGQTVVPATDPATGAVSGQDPATTAPATTAPATTQPAAPAAAVLTPEQILANARAHVAAMGGAPNKLVARNWMRLDPDTQQFNLGAFEETGVSGAQVNHTLQRLMPQFRAPGAGQIY